MLVELLRVRLETSSSWRLRVHAAPYITFYRFPDISSDFARDSEKTYKFPEKCREQIPAWKHYP
jgi:hypothetical protein